MLSRNDIEKELGKNINIFPLKLENIKENSVNLTVSQNAWTRRSADVFWYGDDNFTMDAKGNYKKKMAIKDGEKCIFEVASNKRWMILLPHTTTIVETSEVIAVGENIGGALHSKVGVVAKGIGHIGTMLGPGFCGHLMISLHNISDKVVAIPVGATFVSLTFDYLNSRVHRTSSTISGHVDKFSELGLKANSATTTYLTEDWKSTIGGVQQKMIQSEAYINLENRRKRERFEKIKRRFNKRSIISVVCIIALFGMIWGVASHIDTLNNTTVWVDRFWNVGCSGILCSLLMSAYKFINNED